jgi:hypothetical protein
MSTAAPSPPIGLMPRFSLFIAGVKRTMDEAIGRRPGAEWPLAMLLWNYLLGTQRRLAALHARFATGRLAAVRPRRAPPGGRAAERRPPTIPPGPVLSQFGLGAYADELRALLDDAEMRALLAAAPQAGRLLRPLWRKLTRERLPEMLRLPRKPRPARPAAARTAPGLRLVTLPDGTTLWEPIPCLPFSPPPRWARARAAGPAAPAPAPKPAPVPPQAARPPDWGRPAQPARPRIPWVMGLFQR